MKRRVDKNAENVSGLVKCLRARIFSMLVVNLGLLTSPTPFPLPKLLKSKQVLVENIVLLVISYYLDKSLNILIFCVLPYQIIEHHLYVMLFIKVLN